MRGTPTLWWVILPHTDRGGAADPILQVCGGHHGNGEGQQDDDDEHSLRKMCHSSWAHLAVKEELSSQDIFYLGEHPLESTVASKMMPSL